MKRNKYTIQNDSFFMDGQPGNLARIFASIADSTNCQSHQDKANQKTKTIVKVENGSKVKKTDLSC